MKVCPVIVYEHRDDVRVLILEYRLVGKLMRILLVDATDECGLIASVTLVFEATFVVVVDPVTVS